MRPEFQRAFGGDIGILLPQRPGGRVARIGKLADLFGIEFHPLGLRLGSTLVHQPLVEPGKIRLRHIDLAADLEQVGDGRGSVLPRRREPISRSRLGSTIGRWIPAFAGIQPLRYIPDHPHIGGNILPHLPVPARRRQHQLALLVAQRTGQAVNLVLGGHRHRRVFRQV